MKWSIFVCCALLAGTSIAQEIPIDQLSFPSIDSLDAIKEIKERCDTKGGEGTFEKVQEAKDKLQTCITNMFNVTEIKLELEEKAKTGSMDEVFGKYCNQRPELRTCVGEFIDAAKPCLDEQEIAALNTTIQIAEDLGEFACYRDGERLAMFVAEEGIECLRDHTEGLQKCAENTFKDKSELANADSNEIRSFVFSEDRCNDFDQLKQCVVEELEKCEESTPANVVEAVFKFIKKRICKSTQRKRSIFKRSVVTEWFNQNQTTQQFYDFMKKRCEKYGTSHSYENVKASYLDALTCLRGTRYNFIRGSDSHKEKVHNCMRPFLKDMKVCLPEEEQYIPQFYLDLLDNLVDFFISKRSEIQTQSFSMEIVSCFQNFKQNTQYLEDLKECITKNEDIEEEDIITKKMLCTEMDRRADCLRESVEAVCVRDIEIHNFISELTTAITSPCEED